MKKAGEPLPRMTALQAPLSLIRLCDCVLRAGFIPTESVSVTEWSAQAGSHRVCPDGSRSGASRRESREVQQEGHGPAGRRVGSGAAPDSGSLCVTEQEPPPPRDPASFSSNEGASLRSLLHLPGSDVGRKPGSVWPGSRVQTARGQIGSGAWARSPRRPLWAAPRDSHRSREPTAATRLLSPPFPLLRLRHSRRSRGRHRAPGALTRFSDRMAPQRDTPSSCLPCSYEGPFVDRT